VVTPARGARRLVAVCLVITASVITVGAVPIGVLAAPAGAQVATPTLTLVGQDAWTPAGGNVHMLLRSTNVPAGTTLALTTHQQVASRNSFDAGISGGNLGLTIDLTRLPFDDLPVDPATGARVLDVSLDDLGARLNTRQSGSGVFPLEVDLRRDDNTVLAHFLTYLVVADVGANNALNVGQPLRVAWVWPLQADPAFMENGAEEPGVAAELLPAGRLGRQVDALAANSDVPLTLAPSPDTLAAWTSLAAQSPAAYAPGVEGLQSVSQRDQVLAGSYVPVDVPSLISHGLSGAVSNELQRGISTLQSFFGTLPDTSAALPGPLDLPSLVALRNASQRLLVVRGSALTPADETFTPAHPTTVLADPNDETTAMTVVPSDEAIEHLLTTDDPPALRAAHVLAALAVVAGEQPNRARGVTIVNPARWDAPDDLVAALLAGLRGNPLVTPVTVNDLVKQVPLATVGDDPDGARVVRTLAPLTPTAPPVKTLKYAQAVIERDAVASLFPSTDARVTNGDRALLSALGSAWANPAGRPKAAELLDGIGASVDGFLAHIRVPDQSSITLTSSTAEIPITFDNDTGQPVRVRIRLESNRLLFPDGAERVVELPPKNHTERIRVETRGPGTFPVVVDVATEGGLPIQTTKLSVRSSVVSGVGVVLMVGALVFLALWWGWDIHRRRRRRARDDAVGATAPVPA
jgi:hypothetical protein